MFARTSALFVFALPVLAAATAFPRNNPPDAPSNQCNTGSLQCCESTQDVSAPCYSLDLKGTHIFNPI